MKGKGAKRDFSSVQEILDRSSAMRRIREHFRQGDLRQIWSEVAGEAVARKTRVSRYHGGKLFVEVSSPPLLQELSTFKKRTLLEKLRSCDGYEGIVDIVFKHG